MKVIYEKEISAIKDWLQRTNAQLSTGALPAFLQTDCWKIQNDLQTISTNIQYQYPFYGHELLEIKNILFSAPQPPYGMMLLNAAAFGELFIIIKHISSEPIDTRFWQDIHPRIIAVSKGLLLPLVKAPLKKLKLECENCLRKENLTLPFLKMQRV